MLEAFYMWMAGLLAAMIFLILALVFLLWVNVVFLPRRDRRREYAAIIEELVASGHMTREVANLHLLRYGNGD